MEPLNRLLELATIEGLLSPINNKMAKLRMSMYADDTAVFVNPVREEIQVVAQILTIFGNASGLITSMGKCVVYPIRCVGINLDEVMEGFQCPIKSFPCNYLGLPLHFRQLHRVEIQPLIDKISNRLPAWRGRFLNKAGRLRLLNSVLSSMPTYFLTVFPPKNGHLSELTKLEEVSCGRERKVQMGVTVWFVGPWSSGQINWGA
jgi:hypothetical protein